VVQASNRAVNGVFPPLFSGGKKSPQKKQGVLICFANNKRGHQLKIDHFTETI
jgi:hypothetical protein